MSTRTSCNCASRAELKRVELAPGLSAQHCEACDGTLLAIGDYRHWLTRVPTTQETAAPTPELADSPSARACPSCARLMHRYRAGLEPDFRLDHCPVCQLVRLDRGEWEALAQAGLSTKLADIVSAAWQRRIQAEELRAMREESLRKKHGEACMDELARIRAWLDTQAQRDELIALLRAGW